MIVIYYDSASVLKAEVQQMKVINKKANID